MRCSTLVLLSSSCGQGPPGSSAERGDTKVSPSSPGWGHSPPGLTRRDRTQRQLVQDAARPQGDIGPSRVTPPRVTPHDQLGGPTCTQRTPRPAAPLRPLRSAWGQKGGDSGGGARRGRRFRGSYQLLVFPRGEKIRRKLGEKETKTALEGSSHTWGCHPCPRVARDGAGGAAGGELPAQGQSSTGDS